MESKYVEIDPAQDSRVYLGGDETVAQQHFFAVTQWDVDNPIRALAILQNAGQLRLLYQSLKSIILLDKQVISKEILSSNINELPGISDQCWKCGSKGEMKKCARCKVSCYCSRVCQKADWKGLHKEMCILPNDPTFSLQ